jgi:acid phosphatase
MKRHRLHRHLAGAWLTLSLAASLVAADVPALSFLVVGDWGREGRFNQRAVAEQMGRVAEARNVAFVISTGDNFNQHGVVGVVDRQWRTSFEDVYTAPSLQIPWYVVLGNHDYHAAAQAEVAYTAISLRWKMPARYFSHRYHLPDGGTVEFFFLDTLPAIERCRTDPTFKDLATQSWSEQLTCLRNGLAGSTADWKFVVGHHAIFSSGARHGDTPELIRDVEPLLERFGVQAYFNGHDHAMEHIELNGVNYFTSGAGSRTRRLGRTHAGSKFRLGNTSGFMVVTLSSVELHAAFIDATGKVAYSTVVPRQPAIPAHSR